MSVDRNVNISFSLTFALLSLICTNCRRAVDPPEEGQATRTQTPTAATSSAVASAPTLTTAASQATQTTASAVPNQGTVMPTNAALATSGDPLKGRFTLEDATKGMAPKGKLSAELVTDAGKLRCELFDDRAPIAVANFVGVARGLRPFKDQVTSEWVKRPGYDGSVFHRIIKGFMIQGGDPTGTGAGEPGYVFPDEVWPGAKHDRRGLLCMANRGPNTNGMQFFILDGPAPHLDRGYTIFGNCGPDSVIEKIASSEVRGDRAVKPPKIIKVTVRRGK